MRVHLVRHGKPLICNDQPPEAWELDPDGISAVRSLASSGALPAEAAWFSSPEPKAIQTASHLTTANVGVIDDFKEQTRPAGWTDVFAIANHRALVSAESSVGPGWESANEVRERVLRGLEESKQSAKNETLVLIGHANAWILLASVLTGKPVDLAAWERMGLPDHCLIEEGEVVNSWGDWVQSRL